MGNCGCTALFYGRCGITQLLCIGDHVLWLGMQQSVRLSWFGSSFCGKNVFCEEEDKLYQVFSEAPAVDSLVSFAVMIGTILFCSGRCRIVPDWSRVPNPWLVFDGIEDLVDGKPEGSELFCQLESSERVWWKNWECLSLIGRLPWFRFLALIVASYCDFDFSLSLPHLVEWLTELFNASSNWM